MKIKIRHRDTSITIHEDYHADKRTSCIQYDFDKVLGIIEKSAEQIIKLKEKGE